MEELIAPNEYKEPTTTMRDYKFNDQDFLINFVNSRESLYVKMMDDTRTLVFHKL